MFGSRKKRLFARMNEYINVMKISVYARLRAKFEEQGSQEHPKELSGAVTNRLFASVPSPVHVNLSSSFIDELATDFLQSEDERELLDGIVMSLQTQATIEADARNSEATNRTLETVLWIGTSIPLPQEEPTPAMMEELAITLQSRYCQ